MVLRSIRVESVVYTPNIHTDEGYLFAVMLVLYRSNGKRNQQSQRDRLEVFNSDLDDAETGHE